jgi:hypothetical protein
MVSGWERAKDNGRSCRSARYSSPRPDVVMLVDDVANVGHGVEHRTIAGRIALVKSPQ